MIHEIKLYGDPVLRKKALAVTEFNEELRQLAADMLETMADANGAGLAAPQIGILQRLYVVNEYGEPDEEDEIHKIGEHILVNPEIISKEGEQFTLEGCLSIPGLRFDGIKRADSVTVRYQDLDGKSQELTASGYLAQALQHEQDHLDGILYFDRLNQKDRSEFMNEYRAEIAKMQKKAKALLRRGQMA